MALRKAFGFTFVVLFAVAASGAKLGSSPSRVPASVDDSPENHAWFSALRQSQFAPIPHPTAYASCEVSDPPEALATPDPLVEFSGPDSKITVSFIVGTDGRVHSLFILDGDTPAEEGTVLKAVRSWRYRPAKCNGIPIDAEARIQFRLH
ncbi:MAG TPA: energy transducer TonB [Terriglobales bacterium]